MKCCKCGTEMDVVKTSRELKLICPNCGCNLVTTISPDSVEDETIYGIYLCGPQKAGKEVLKTVSEIIGSNYLAAKKALSSEFGNLLISAQALKIKRCARALDGVGVRYEIRPAFPYDIYDHSDDNYAI